ncbi:unnamed protein product [Schistosoma turkestanicum]|nr:unnamed protein product [Schistosoma turkestanicum]
MNDYKSFSHLRLIDSEKGYERQGRYLSHVFGTNWYEYWEFLDDFIDLSSEDGMLALEEYLSNYPLLNTTDHQPVKQTINNGNGLNNKNSEDSSSSSCIVTNMLQDDDIQTDCTFSTGPLFADDDDDNGNTDNDIFAPTTPIIRGKLLSKSNLTNNNELFKSSSHTERWISYRHDRNYMHGLNDSLEDSSEQTNTDIQSHEEISSCENSVDKVVVVSPIVGLLKRLTFVSPMSWLKTSNQLDKNDQISSTTDNIISIEDANSTTNQHTDHMSELRHSNKRRISATSIRSLDSSLEKPGGKKHSPEKTKTKPTCQLITKQLPHYFIHIYKALPGNDNELKDFNPPELPPQKPTPSLVLCALNNSKFLKCIELTEYFQSYLKRSS